MREMQDKLEDGKLTLILLGIPCKNISVGIFANF